MHASSFAGYAIYQQNRNVRVAYAALINMTFFLHTQDYGFRRAVKSWHHDKRGFSFSDFRFRIVNRINGAFQRSVREPHWSLLARLGLQTKTSAANLCYFPVNSDHFRK